MVRRRFLSQLIGLPLLPKTELRKGGVDLVLLKPLLDFLRPQQRQLHVS